MVSTPLFLILPAAQKAGVGVLDPSLRGLYPRAKAQARPDQAPPRPRPQSPLRTSARSRFASRVPAPVGPPTWSRYCRTRFRSRSRFMAARPGSPTERRPPPRRAPSFPQPTEPARSPLSSRPTPRTARNLPLPARPRPGSSFANASPLAPESGVAPLVPRRSLGPRVAGGVGTVDAFPSYSRSLVALRVVVSVRRSPLCSF